MPVTSALASGTHLIGVDDDDGTLAPEASTCEGVAACETLGGGINRGITVEL